MLTQSRRARTNNGRLSLSVATVVRPTGVLPTIRSALCVQTKCSRRICRRGLKIATVSPDSGSMPVARSPLKVLHAEQAGQRFSSTVRPTRASEIMWSTSIGEPTTFSAVWQRHGPLKERGDIFPAFLEPRHCLRPH